MIDYLDKKTYTERHEEVIKEIHKLSGQLTKHYSESIETERQRLASEIINFAEDIKNKLPKSSVAYEHIHICYKRYKDIGGNHYIDKVFEYIQNSMGEDDV